jgi:DNA helicase-2/ATP-dependent DNA helicase PcrA
LSGQPHLEGDLGPSRFVQELCFDLSQELGDWLENRSTDQHQLKVNTPVTATAERYAAHEAVTLEGSRAPAAAANQPVWSLARISHAVLGPGEVTGEDQSSFEVRFDSGDTLNFSKKSAHLYFKAAPSQG